MHYAYRFRLKPTAQQLTLLDYHRDTCRQLYNHALGEFNEIPESAGTLNQRVRQVRDQLTELKDWWDDLNDLYSTVAQAAVMRIEDSIKAPSELAGFLMLGRTSEMATLTSIRFSMLVLPSRTANPSTTMF